MLLLYIVTPGQYFLSHRLSLALAAAAEGWDVHVAVPPGQDAVNISRYGFSVHTVPLARSMVSPLLEARSFIALIRLCRRLTPDLIHAISPKAAVLGGLAARLTGIPAIVMKGGIGSTATGQGFKNKVARTFVRIGINLAVTSRARVIVQNQEELSDLAYYSTRIITRSSLIQGAGVDCQQFAPTLEPPEPVTIVLPARMLFSKGVGEFVEAAQLLKTRGINARFVLAGGIDDVNVTAVPAEMLMNWQQQGTVHWLGHCNDMPSLLAKSHIICLPSYCEGLPKALTEAAAAGRPIVATDVPGCRDVVVSGLNGLLVPARDSHALASALEVLIKDRNLRERFGQAGRLRALEKFDYRIIIPPMLALYKRTMNTKDGACLTAR